LYSTLPLASWPAHNEAYNGSGGANATVAITSAISAILMASPSAANKHSALVSLVNGEDTKQNAR
jgi:hypothetical protein